MRNGSIRIELNVYSKNDTIRYDMEKGVIQSICYVDDNGIC